MLINQTVHKSCEMVWSSGVIKNLLILLVLTIPVAYAVKIHNFWITSNDAIVFICTCICLLVMLKKKLRIELKTLPLFYPVLAFLATLFLSFLNTINLFLSIKEFVKFVFIFVLFYLFIIYLGKVTAEELVGMLCSIATVISLWAILDFVSGKFMLLERLWCSYFVPYPHLNALGTYLLIILPFNFFAIFTQNNKFLKVWHLVGLICQLTALAITLSRSNWLGLVVALFILCFSRYKVRGILYSIMALLLLIFFGSIFLSQRVFWKRVSSITDFKESNVVIRIKHMHTAIKMIRRSPLVGIGVGNYQVAAGKYYNCYLEEMAHNVFLHLGAEAGIFAIIAFLWFIISYLKFTIKEYKQTTDKNTQILLLCILASFIGLMVSVQFGDPFVYKIKEFFALLCALPFLVTGKKTG